MQTLQERKDYRGTNFMELELNAINNVIQQVEAIDVDRFPHNKEDMIKLRMIKKRKEDTAKLWEYLLTQYTW